MKFAHVHITILHVGILLGFPWLRRAPYLNNMLLARHLCTRARVPGPTPWR